MHGKHPFYEIDSLLAKLAGCAVLQLQNATFACFCKDNDVARRLTQDVHERSAEIAAAVHSAKRKLSRLRLNGYLADELRTCISAERVVSYLEVINSRAVDIAQVRPNVGCPGKWSKLVELMGAAVPELVRAQCAAYMERDFDQALKACRREERIQGVYRRKTERCHSTDGIGSELAWYLSRIAQEASKIGETVIYLVTGEEWPRAA